MRKQILISTSSTSPFIQLIPYYEQRGFEVAILLSGIKIFNPFLNYKNISLVIMDESLSRKVSLSILNLLKNKVPFLPILYIDGKKHQTWEDSRALPDILLDPTFDCEQVIVHADYLLRLSHNVINFEVLRRN